MLRSTGARRPPAGSGMLDGTEACRHRNRMSEIRSICVFCGSALGSDPAFEAAARALGETMAREQIRLVYGGGSIGLMGAVARAVLDGGGTVLGVIPQFLVDREVMLPEVSELVVTKDMHQRKRIMFEQCDAFVTLPGGIGTLEEVVEQMTWVQLGQHAKPIVLADIGGFWHPLAELLEHMRRSGFIRPGLEVSYSVVGRIEDVIPTARAVQAQTRAAVGAAVPLDRL
jgi:uncharacterized protein (TIGR00730 family)